MQVLTLWAIRGGGLNLSFCIYFKLFGNDKQSLKLAAGMCLAISPLDYLVL